VSDGGVYAPSALNGYSPPPAPPSAAAAAAAAAADQEVPRKSLLGAFQ
jgi:hypothetical protein